MAPLELLKSFHPCEYPAEFLAARLRGKKNGLFCDWETILAGGNITERLRNTPFYPYLREHGHVGVYRFLQHDHLWVYTRMNNRLRCWFKAYFSWHELNTLIICLRSFAGTEKNTNLPPLLHHSLLHDAIQNILAGSGNFTDALQELETFFVSSAPADVGLCAGYESGGMQGLETLLRNLFWESVLSRKQPLLLKTFFRYLVDFYNTITLAKSIRWRIETEPQLLPGGMVPLERFRKAFRLRDLAPLLQPLRLQMTDGDPPAGPGLETLLMKSIGTRLKKYYRQRTETGDILFYLWEQYRSIRNVSLVLNAAFAGEKRLRKGLVL